MKLNALKLKSLLTAVVFAASAVSMVAYAPVASAQATSTLDPATAAALNDALAAGNAQLVETIVAANVDDAAALQAIAAIVLAAAQSIKTADPAGAGVLAAIALTSGGLQGNAMITATNIVTTSGSAIASIVVTFANAGIPPAVVANAVLVGVTVNPVQLAQNGANVAGFNQNAGSIQ